MNASRVGTGELVAGAGGLLLALAMFLPWFGVDASVRLPGADAPVTVDHRSLNAWQSFGGIDLVLAATAVLALALPVVPRRAGTPLSLAVIVGAAVSALAIVLRLLDPPSLPLVADPDTASEVGSRVGAFFGLLCTAGIAWAANRAAAAPVAQPITRDAVDAECGRAWRSYDRRLGTHYARYFERRPDLRGGQRFAARDLEAALPPGAGALAGAVPAWHRHHLSGKSTQTLAVGLLGVAARREPSLAWLFEALGLPSPRAPRMEFEHDGVDVVVEDAQVVLCLETRWRESGVGACTCRGGRCSRRMEGRPALWAAGTEVFGLPPREPESPCPISPLYEVVRCAAAARELAGPDRLAVTALIYDAANPYFAGWGEWRGWPAVLEQSVGRAREFRFASLSWQELVPRLPLDEVTRGWAREKHGLG